MTRGLSATFRRVRDEVEQYGQDKKDAAVAELGNLTQRVPLIKQIATRNFADVHDLLVAGTRRAQVLGQPRLPQYRGVPCRIDEIRRWRAAHRACVRVACVALGSAAMIGGTAPAAPAASVREVVPKTIAFSSDGARYVAWQVRGDARIVALDTRTGHRSSIAPPAGCRLEPQSGEQPEPTAAGGYFLLDCSPAKGSERKSILNVKTGTSATLPEGPTGFGWHLVQGHYVEGMADEHTCQRRRTPRGPGEVCIALYQIAAGTISDRPAWQVPDLDRPGAPPVCRALRRKLLADKESGLPKLFSYADGLLAHPAHRAGSVQIDRCKGGPIVLRGHDEPRNFDIRAGVLTWDTAHHATDSEPREDVRHGTLRSYRIAKRMRRSWPLPSLTLRGGLPGVERGVFGYATHTANTVFWIASSTLGYSNEGKTTFVETSSIFAAQLG